MIDQEEAFDLRIYDKAGGNRQWLSDPASLVFTPRHNQQPTGEVRVPTDHEKAPLVLADGSRYVLRYQDEYTSSGVFRLHRKEGVGAEAEFAWQMVDDWRLLTRLLGRQVPGATSAGQGAAAYHVVGPVPAETAVKTVITANAARLAGVGLPVICAPDLGRGANVTLEFRHHKLADRLLPAIDHAGIGVTVRQVISGGVPKLEVDCYQPTVWPIRLSEDAGTIIAGTWSRELPSVTRVYVGIGGEDETRQYFGPFINAAAEAETGDWIEDFVDARDIKLDDPARATLAAARAAEVLAAGSWKAGLTVEFAETDNYRYGGPKGVHVGDQLPFELSGVPGAEPVVLTDVLRAATLTLSSGEGVAVTPTVGDRTDDPNVQVLRAVSAVAKRQRALQAGV